MDKPAAGSSDNEPPGPLVGADGEEERDHGQEDLGSPAPQYCVLDRVKILLDVPDEGCCVLTSKRCDLAFDSDSPRDALGAAKVVS